jgi:DNA-binding transcriptional ArsR family regulator
MTDETPRSITRLTDARALRALAHPTRLALVGLLRREGPLTATRAGERLGQSSANASFHLRQLAKYGLVEEAGGGTGRERPWRATTMFTAWPDAPADPEVAAATGLLSQVIAERYFEDLTRWLDRSGSEPVRWRQAAVFGDSLVWVTADELADLGREQYALAEPYLDRLERPELRPEGARLVTFLHVAFPGDPAGPAEAGS